MARRVLGVCVALILALGTADAGVNPPYCNKTVGIPVPSFEPNHEIGVYYLEAPLFKSKFGDLGLLVELFHVGVGLVDHTDGKEYVVEYIAEDGVIEAIFPTIENGTSKLDWEHDRGGWCVLDVIDKVYWDKGITLLGTINGTVATDLGTWMTQDNSTFWQYQLWEVRQGRHGKVLIDASTCIEATWRAFTRLNEMGLQYNSSQVVRANTISILASSITKEDITDPVILQKAVKFYTDATEFKHEKPLKVIEQLLMMFLLDVKFVYVKGDYYSFKGEFPYFRVAYERHPLPGQGDATVVSAEDQGHSWEYFLGDT
eukprot:CAMPEP_0114563792 /NCGR_PEP_ID=MMETSP0114-20121206/13323_1 /TAXON_ID=31324 /ORGANISM="Goniomonas sp, Strain m" /LENGTH=314 /DNA_ID=CAMNT_0001749711 /DNA_START=6 /DNA_END=946 /DNA_ORIENTATION=-